MEIIDDLGRKVLINTPPKRVVSLVPSLTLTLSDLGIEKQLVGITRFCIYPEHLIDSLPIIGGPKNIDVEKILWLKPDIVFAVKEENEKKQILELAKKVPVVVFDIYNPEDAFKMMKTLGEIFKKNEKAANLTLKIKHALVHFPIQGNGVRAIYLIWKKPWMAAGTKTYIGSMLKKAGFQNIVEGRYPEINMKLMDQADTILLASEPYHFKEEDKQALQLLFPDKTVKIVSGELFTWFGTYLLRIKD